jgi:hypothetical protein
MLFGIQQMFMPGHELARFMAKRTCDAEARWDLGDRWICLHLKPSAEPPLPYEAMVYLGFDANAQEYLAY